MNTTVMKTKAERSIPEQFAAALPGLPGGDGVRKTREAAMARFSALGLPHRRIEEWKYTDLRAAMKEALSPAAGRVMAVTTAQRPPTPLGVR